MGQNSDVRQFQEMNRFLAERLTTSAQRLGGALFYLDEYYVAGAVTFKGPGLSADVG